MEGKLIGEKDARRAFGPGTEAVLEAAASGRLDYARFLGGPGELGGFTVMAEPLLCPYGRIGYLVSVPDEGSEVVCDLELREFGARAAVAECGGRGR